MAKLDDTCPPPPLPRISGTAAIPPALLGIVAPASSTTLEPLPAASMPRAACKPLFSKNLSCLDNVVRSAPPSKSALQPSPTIVPQSKLGRLARIPNHQFPHVLRLHLLRSGSFQDVCRLGIQLCCKSVTTTADKCSRAYLQRVAGLLAIIAVAFFCPDNPILGPDSLIVFPKKMSQCLMRLHGIWIAGSAFGCKSAIVVVKHLPRPPHCAASAAFVRVCLIHVGSASTAAVSEAFCAHAPFW